MLTDVKNMFSNDSEDAPKSAKQHPDTPMAKSRPEETATPDVSKSVSMIYFAIFNW